MSADSGTLEAEAAAKKRRRVEGAASRPGASSAASEPVSAPGPSISAVVKAEKAVEGTERDAAGCGASTGAGTPDAAKRESDPERPRVRRRRPRNSAQSTPRDSSDASNDRALYGALAAPLRAGSSAAVALSQERSAHEAELYGAVLAWNFFAMPKLGRGGDRVPVKFGTPEAYVASFTPLVLEEVRAQIENEAQRSGVEATDGAPVALDPVCSASGDGVFIKVPFHREGLAARAPRDGDLILLSPHADCMRERRAEHVLGHCYWRSGILRLLRTRYAAVVKPQHMRHVQARRAGRRDGDGAPWHLWPLGNATSALREFQALHSVRHLRLREALLRAEEVPSAGLVRTLQHVGPAFAAQLRDRFNPSQLAAVEAAATNVGFTLVQGPPGTGKTSTLLGLLNTVHLCGFHRRYERMLSRFHAAVERAKRVAQRQQEGGEEGGGGGEGAARNGAGAEGGQGPRSVVSSLLEAQSAQLGALIKQITSVDSSDDFDHGRVLVTAPSNAAVDEIAGRIMVEGFRDGNGQRYNPPILRVGRGAGTRVREVTLDHEVSRLMAMPREEAEGHLRLVRAQMQEAQRAVVAIGADVRQAAMACFRAGLPLQSDEGGGAVEEEESGGQDADECNGVRVKEEGKEEKDVKEESDRVGADEDDTVPRRLASPRAPTLDAIVRASHKLEEPHPLQVHFEQAAAAWLRAHEARSQAQREERRLSCIAQGDRGGLEARLLADAHIVFTTLSSSGLRVLEAIPGADGRTVRASCAFETVIVDEAAQSVELATLIPLRYDCRQCVLVGDPQQLPATVFSRAAVRSGYDRSLFRRLQRCGMRVHMLDVQYRCHPEIAAFPAAYFYKGRLANGDNVRSPAWRRPFHAVPCFPPILFWDLQSTGVKDETKSWLNPEEASLVVNIYRTLRGALRQVPMRGRVGVVTPYAKQVHEIKRQLRAEMGAAFEGERIDVNTVDAFQGQEKDIIILSLVRAGENSGVGFVDDVRRMNVALTRAKFGLWIIGSATVLQQSDHWGSLLEHLRAKRRVVPLRRGDEPLIPAANMFGIGAVEPAQE